MSDRGLRVGLLRGRGVVRAVIALAAVATWLLAPLRLPAWQARGSTPAVFSAHSGEFLHAIVAQGEVDVTVSVFDEDGLSVGRFDSFNFGAEPVAFVAPRTGRYTFRVARVDGRPLARVPVVSVVARRDPTPIDTKLIAALRLGTEAKELQAEPTSRNLQSALLKSRQALQIWRELTDPSAAARSLINIGGILYAQSAYAEAVEAYRESLRLAETTADPRIAAESRNNAGLCALQLGQTDSALSLLGQALNDWRALRHTYGEAAAAVNLGLLSWRLGSFDAAVQYQRQAFAAFSRLGERRGAALALNNLGLVYSSLNQPDLALKQLQRARFAFRALGDQGAESQALINIGYLYLLGNDTARAVRSQEQATLLLRDSPDVRARADAMTNLARALSRDQPVRSLRLLGDALSLYESIGDRRGRASALHHLGRGHAAAGDTDLGLQELDRAFQIRSEAGIRDAAAESLFEGACILETQGRTQAAAERLARVIDITEALRTVAGGEGFRTSYFASKQVYFDRYVALLMKLGRTSDAFAVSERARGRALLDILSSMRQRIRSAADPVLLTRKDRIERDLNFQSQQLLSLTRGKPDSAREASLRASIDDLFADLDQVEGEIRRGDPSYANLWNPRPVRIEELQALLDDRTELLEFALGETQSYLWVAARSELRAFPLPSRSALEATARDVVRLSAAFRMRQRDPVAERQFRMSMARMGRQLFGAAAGFLDRERWVVIPDGLLHYLPFSAVRLSAPGSAVRGGGSEIVVLPSASALVLLHGGRARRRPAAGTIAIFADPVFDRDDPRLPPKGGVRAGSSVAPLARLPFSRREADEIAALLPPGSARVSLGFDANKMALLGGAAGRYRILHLATHAILDDTRPGLSRIAMSQVDRQGRQVDGFLRLFEIYNLQLPATSLVVLSACDSGTGKYVRGEGLIGFAQGFLHAGAGGVLASLWAVEDQAGAELIRRFYEALLVRGLMPGAALAKAQASMRTDSRWRDPYYWAGFVLISDPD